MKIAVLSIFLALTLCASAQVTTMSIEFGGAKAGSNSFEKKADGSFTSTVKLSIAGQTLDGTLEGKYEGAKIVSYVAKSGSPTGPVEISLQEGKVKATQAGKSADIPFNYTGTAYFSSLHPQFVASTLLAADWEKKEAQEIPTFLLDGAAILKPKVTPLAEKPSKAGAARMYKMTMSGIDVEYALSEGKVVAMDVPAQKLRMIAEGWESLYVDPLAAYPELSQPTLEVTLDKGVRMKTRDGAELVSDVIRPAAPGKYPVILVRTPYGRATSIDGPFYARRGYVYVSQDCRGRGESGGEWDPFVNERKDGYDAVEWASKQPWSDGKVGMIGASYGGLVQWAAAVEGHPALKCLIPQVSPPDAMRNIPYDMGAFFLFGNLWWAQIVKDKDANLAAVRQSVPNLQKLTTLPLSKVDDEVFGTSLEFYDKWLDRDTMAHWKGFDWVSDLPKTNVPALHISGWWDGDLVGTMTNWQTLRSAGKKNQYLIYGPWTHAFNTSTRLGDLDYGPSAILELDSVYLRWFDTWLKGKSVNQDKMPRVRAFVTGANKWVDLADWPDRSGPENKLFLYAEAPANGKSSHGELRDAPAREQEPSRYLYNPANATVPKELESMDPDKASTKVTLDDDSDGALVFKTVAFPRATAIAGPFQLTIKFSTSARDTDFFASLFDIDPKGEMRQIARSGKIRASYLGGFQKPKPVTPNKIYTAKIDIWDTAHEFKPGHRMALIITSDQFPVFARNLGTGERIKNATRMVAQANTIYHDSKNPSILSFRVLY